MDCVTILGSLVVYFLAESLLWVVSYLGAKIDEMLQDRVCMLIAIPQNQVSCILFLFSRTDNGQPATPSTGMCFPLQA